MLLELVDILEIWFDFFGERGGGRRREGEAYPFVAFLSRSAVDHASL